MRVSVVLLVAAVLWPAPASSQQAADPEVYRRAVDVYVKTGDITSAVRPLQQWKPQEFESAIAALMLTKDAGLMLQSTVFHLDIGVALVGLVSGTAKRHIDFGEGLLNKVADLRKNGVRVDNFDEFRSMWLAVAGSAYLSIKDVQRAMPYLDEARDVMPKSAHALTMLGTAWEVDAGSWNPNDWQTLSQRENSLRQRLNRLGRAESFYREALRIEPAYATALIRLGRVLYLNGKLAEARQSLDRGIAEARRPSDHYIGALFMAALLVDQKDVAGARQSYEKALAIAPLSQPANIGLAHLELMAGRPDRAQALVRGFAAGSATDTWWAYKDGSLDLPGLAWLRARTWK